MKGMKQIVYPVDSREYEPMLSEDIFKNELLGISGGGFEFVPR